MCPSGGTESKHPPELAAHVFAIATATAPPTNYTLLIY